jgi:glycosyltransferase involved in cell wall biosynthesis
MTTSSPTAVPDDAAQQPIPSSGRGTVGVVIPVFNRATLVLEALESVLEQTLPPERIVVVDDGSTDGTAESVRAWMRAHADAGQAALVQRPHEGAAAARNAGLARLGSCDFVAFLDSDDRWPPDFLERTQLALRQAPSAVAASCDRRFVSPTPGSERTDQLDGLAAQPTSWLFTRGSGVLSCTLLRTHAVAALGGFQAELLTGQDWALLLRLSSTGRWLHCMGAPVAFGRGLSAARGEYDHLRKAIPDYKLRWVRILEEWLWHHGGAELLSESLYRRELARRWSQAARQLLRAGRSPEARAAFRRSAHFRPRPRTYLRLMLTYLRP